ATTGTTTVLAPVDGNLISLDQVQVEGHPFKGLGFAIQPASGHVYAPFDGTVVFLFSTKHLIGLVSDQGLKTIIHIGVGTVNMRGEGFVTHCSEGERVHSGQLLMDFNR
ncbi:PTS glucose transporter subunit IIA, partial [Ligilactobacillus salivarius]